MFDANELVTFARVFEYPVAYFLLPVFEPSGYEENEIFYQLTRPGEADGVQIERLLEKMDLIDVALPLRYPATVVDEVNKLLRSQGLSWQPYVRMEWEDGSGDYDNWRALTRGGAEEGLSLDEWKTITEFAALTKKHPSVKILRLLTLAMESSEKAGDATTPEGPPF